MSIVGLLLGWTGLPKWASELVLIGVVAAGAVGAFWLYHHHVYVEGIHAQQVADQRASAKVVAQANAETKAAQATADAAHAAYISEVNHDQAAAVRQPLPAVRLCLHPHRGGSGLSESRSPHAGNAGARAPAGRLPAVSTGNRPVRGGPGPNISPLLDALAASADQVSAVLREYQARNPR